MATMYFKIEFSDGSDPIGFQTTGYGFISNEEVIERAVDEGDLEEEMAPLVSNVTEITYSDYIEI